MKKLIILFFNFYLFIKCHSPLIAQNVPIAKKEHIVIVHGAWGGGWAFKKLDSLLTHQGFEVSRPTLTGLGEKVHLSSPEIDLKTHINDIVNFILFEDLHDIILMGHSYGGMVITGVADKLPDRIKKLIYLDAMVPLNGESALSQKDEKRTTWIKSMTRSGFLVPSWLKDINTYPRDVPQSLKTFTQPIVLKNDKREQISSTYILTVEEGKKAEEDDFASYASRAKQKKWDFYSLTSDHNPHWSHPQELVTLLLEITEKMEQRKEK